MCEHHRRRRPGIVRAGQLFASPSAVIIETGKRRFAIRYRGGKMTNCDNSTAGRVLIDTLVEYFGERLKKGTHNVRTSRRLDATGTT